MNINFLLFPFQRFHCGFVDY